MMLPEFRTRVLMSAEAKEPSLQPDEEALEVIESRIKRAVATGAMVKVIMQTPQGRTEKAGQITAILPASREIKLLTSDKRLNVPVDSVLSVEWL